MAAAAISSSVVPVTTNSGPETWNDERVAARPAQAALDGRHRDFLDVTLGREPVDDDAVGDLARDLGHLLPDRGEEHLRRAVRDSGVGAKNGVINVWR